MIIPKKKNFIIKEYNENFVKLCKYSKEVENLNMKKCNNKYIIKSLDDFIQDDKIIMVIECVDSTLRALLEEKKSLEINEIKKLIIKLNEGIKHLNKKRINNIIISPENIGIINNKKSKTYSLKLIDLFPYYEIKYNLKEFNYKSKIFNYMSPEKPLIYDTPGEILKDNNFTLNTQSKSILWNIGVLMYELYFGELPKIEENSDKNLILNVNNLKKSGDLLFDELITKLLTKEFKKRIDWDDYVNHKFFADMPMEEICEILYGIKINKDMQELDIISEEIDDFNLKKIFKINFNDLLQIDLSNNYIKDISSFNQNHLQKLKILNLKNNKISVVDGFSLKNLEFLFLNSNMISTLKSFQSINFENLCYLSLSKNNINDISPLNNVNLLNLNILNLSFNNIKNISAFYKIKIPFLKELYLSNNNIKELFGLLNTNFKELEILDLESNQIEDINVLAQVNFQQKLKELNLANNPIIYYEILNLCYFQSLEKIYFNSNDPKFQIISLKLNLYGYEFEKDENDLNNVSALFAREGISKFDIANLGYKDSFKIITNKKVYIPNLQKFFIEKVLEMDSELVEENKIFNIRENDDYNTTINEYLDNYKIFFYSFTENIVENQIKTSNFYLIKEYYNLHKIKNKYNRIPKYLEEIENNYYLNLDCQINKIKSKYYNSLPNQIIENNKSLSSILKKYYYYNFFPLIFINSQYYKDFLVFLENSPKFEEFKVLKEINLKLIISSDKKYIYSHSIELKNFVLIGEVVENVNFYDKEIIGKIIADIKSRIKKDYKHYINELIMNIMDHLVEFFLFSLNKKPYYIICQSCNNPILYINYNEENDIINLNINNENISISKYNLNNALGESSKIIDFDHSFCKSLIISNNLNNILLNEKNFLEKLKEQKKNLNLKKSKIISNPPKVNKSINIIYHNENKSHTFKNSI